MKTVVVAWFERPSMRRRWCRALRKTTTDYADVVHTRCGYVVTLPIGLSDDVDLVNCDECLALASKTARASQQLDAALVDPLKARASAHRRPHES